MNKIFIFTITFFLVMSYNLAFANNLTSEAESRGINIACLSHLAEIESYHNLDGLNITFAHPTEPSNYPSLHTSNKKYNNGSSFFTTTLSPESDFCYASINKVAVINDQSCSNIAKTRLEEDSTLIMQTYAEGSYIHISPESSEYQLILIPIGDSSCAMSESRMLWPGK
jgi:hypothetical protein